MNPESGSIGYTYYSNGNLKTRRWGGVVLTIGYHALNRVTTKGYTGIATRGAILLRWRRVDGSSSMLQAEV